MDTSQVMNLLNHNRYSPINPIFFFCLFVVVVVAISLATPAAYGGSQARGLIGATAAILCHSSQQHQTLNPLSKARD